MAIVAGVNRGWIQRDTAACFLLKMVKWLSKADSYHGAFPHWYNGATGKTIPFSRRDNGADLVESSFLLQGLLCVRQYFDKDLPLERELRGRINGLWNKVEWNWFQQNNQQVLYTYPLSLGPDYGGPLFFAHYSFLGLNPNGLTDNYAGYFTQNKNHTLINYTYCRTNPAGYYGYSDSVWGLTASNTRDGYTASAPANDRGFIAPTAALSSFPYTPKESMAALHFYYYVLGDKIWKQYGFVDAFSLDVLKNNGPWFDDAFLAIDQGPIIVMLENYRTGLLWHLFMSAPEVQAGLQKLGFTFSQY